MRIGTWNMAGWRRPGWQALLLDADCDVWLLTEVDERVELDGYERHLTAGLMDEHRRWAGIYSRRQLIALPDPHPASAAAVVDGTTYCSSILPWRSCGGEPTWPGVDHAAKTGLAVEQVVRGLATTDLVWGGDWNHALSGTERAGSDVGRAHLLAALAEMELQVPTASLPHQIAGALSIDHIAVPRSWAVRSAERLDAAGLSDHDAYVVDVERGEP